MKEVPFYHSEGSKLVCDLCPHHCKLRDMQKGVCRFRQRQGDKLMAMNYAQAASIALDPIEKKPLYHFKPGSAILSVGANGCNLKCDFCQNCEISQGEVPAQYLAVNDLLDIAKSQNSVGVAFTYSEPLMWYEYVLDASIELRRKGLASVLVTNGFIEEDPLLKLLPYIDAMNIDLKSMQPDFYKRLCKGRLEPVQKTIEISYNAGIHVELTHLIVTGWNDNPVSVADVVKWVASVSSDIPLHLSRYFPRYKYSQPSTSESFMRDAFSLAKQELKYVYLGNIAGGIGSNTNCPHCGQLLIERKGYRTFVYGLQQNRCTSCDTALPIK